MKNFFKNFGIAILWLLGFIFIESAGAIIAMFFLDANDSMYTVTLLGIVIAVIPSVLLLFQGHRKRGSESLKRPCSENICLSLFGGVAFYILISYLLVLLFMLLPENITDTYTVGDDVATVSSSLLVFLATGICAPIIEEIFFRYGIQTCLQKVNPVFALFAQAILFGLAHGNIIQGIYAFIIGFALGFIYYKSQNLLYPIIIHVTFNSINFVVTEYEITSMSYIYIVALISFTLGWIILKLKDKKTRTLVDEAIAKVPNALPFTPLKEESVKNAEQMLKLKFADDYKYFLYKYGFLCFNDFYLNGVNCLASYDVVYNTLYFRDIKKIPENLYVLRCFTDGDTAILQDVSGKIYFYNDFGAIILLCDSLSKFIGLEVQRMAYSGNVTPNPPVINI